ncbi:MAG TPA: lipopolysaccharide transport periplasmic protein LptA [Methylomirabilota bacterium]|nr:lipopolysaccharide transport periplasmic protein LptA [Methylomirabilota bacterium]
MRRALALAVALLWVAPVVGAGAEAQAPKPRPAQATAPKRSPADPSARPGGDRNAPVEVLADHLENLQKESLNIFTGNVVATQNNSTMYADRMEVYLDAKGDRVVRGVATGNVRIITRDCRMGTARRAEYYDDEQRVVLIGNARVWREDNVVTGERITMFLAEDRNVVDGGPGGRVKGIFYPKSPDQAKPAPRPAAGAPCG